MGLAMMTDMPDTIDRTPPIGLFNFAESYRAAADILAHQHARELRFDSPMRYLYYHCIELYMKAFLRSEGLRVSEMKTRLGHHFSGLRQECISRGLVLKGDDGAMLDWIGDDYMDSRYLETGSKTVASIEGLSRVAVSIANTVGRHLMKKGVVLQTIRESPF